MAPLVVGPLSCGDLRELLNYRHPGLRREDPRVRAAGRAPLCLDPLDPLSNSGRLSERVKHPVLATFSQKVGIHNWLGLPKIVFGHNLHHMAPFEILEAGCCTCFRRASFWFSVPWVNFVTPNPEWVPLQQSHKGETQIRGCWQEKNNISPWEAKRCCQTG